MKANIRILAGCGFVRTCIVAVTAFRLAPMHRRDLLKQLAAGFLALASGLTPTATPAVSLASASTEPFDEARLRQRARALAARPYHPRNAVLPPPLAGLGWDAYQSIGYRADHALWAGQRLPFEARFFHLGLFFKSPVRMHEVVDGQSRVIAYDPAMFDYGKSGLDHASLPADLGFAGFRLTTRADPTRDVAAFLGASYFRAVGGQWQYGMSARGLAIDTGLRRAEEFPDFTEFWLVRPAPQADTLRVYALLDSPSVAGVYRFDIRPGDTLAMDVQATLFVRKPIERLGIAPLTSMFLYGENDRTDRAGDRRSAARRWRAADWRPEIHDSDGLAIWRGSGEWIWRPLANPPALRSQRFADDGPRGFGLLQRDRNPDHYQDDGVFYEKRPSVWVEPLHGWGEGAVEVVELSAADETFDNIVAFWRPAVAPQAGQELAFGYRLSWGAQPPAAPPLARVVATRTGIGGIVGQPRRYFSWRFVVDFAGGELGRLGGGAIEPVIRVSRGRVEIVSARPLASIDGVRAMFDLVPDADNAPIELRLTLQSGDRPLSETWAYQWTPPADRAV